MRCLFFFILAVMLASCDPVVDTNQTGEINAWVPVYAQPAVLTDIATVAAQPTAKAGKIYAYGNYIFQNDQNKGIHIIDNSVPANPQKLAFLKIPFSTEIAIKGNYLYTNSVSDLLVFNLANPQQPSLVKRVSNAFPVVNQEYPPFERGYFECVDPSKGIVVDWQLKMVTNPQCRR